MFCTQCGAKLPENSKFCHECGNKLLSSSEIVTDKKTEPQIVPENGKGFEQTIEQKIKSPQIASTNDNSEYDERSGKGKDSIIPKEIIEWNWGAAGLGIIWGIYHKVWVSFLTLVVPFGWIAMGKAGNGWAWRNKKWKSVEEFKMAQAKWQVWGKICFIIILAINLIPYLALFQSNAGTNSLTTTNTSAPLNLSNSGNKNIIIPTKNILNINKEQYVEETLRCKTIGEEYKNAYTQGKITYFDADYSPKLDICLIMYEYEYNVAGWGNKIFTTSTIKDLSGKYDSHCLINSDDPIFDNTRAKFLYLVRGVVFPNLPEGYIQNIKSECNISF